MENLLQEGATWLEEQRTEFVASSVTYARGELSVVVAATFGKSEYDVAQDDIALRAECRDYIISVADLVLDGVAVRPERGDLITAAAAPGLQYEVLPLGAGKGPDTHWRYSDDFWLAYRIHTKLVKRS